MNLGGLAYLSPDLRRRAVRGGLEIAHGLRIFFLLKFKKTKKFHELVALTYLIYN